MKRSSSDPLISFAVLLQYNFKFDGYVDRIYPIEIKSTTDTVMLSFMHWPTPKYSQWQSIKNETLR